MRRLALGGLFAGGLALLTWGALEGRGDLAVVSGIAVVVLAAAPTVSRLRIDRLDGPGVYALLSALFFGPVSLTWLGGDPALPAPGVDQADIAQALVLVAAALVAFGAGARIAGPARPRDPVPRGTDKRAPVTVVLIVFALGGVGVTAGVLLGAVGFRGDAGEASGVLRYGQVFQQLSVVGAFAALAFAIWVFRHGNRRHVWLLLTLVAVQSALGFVTGFKLYAILPSLFVVAAWISCQSRVPWKVILAGVIVALVVLLPATIVYRSTLRANPVGARDVTTPSGLVQETGFYLSIRFRLIDHVALIDTRTPEVYPYGSGRRYLLLPALIGIPRAVWADKPILDDGAEFSTSYWELPPSYETSTPLTQPGDLIRNFGAAGMLGGMLVWGLMVGLFTRWCLSRRSPRLEMVYLVALITTIAYVEEDLPQLLAAASRTLLFTAAVAWLVLPGRDGRPGSEVLRRRIAAITKKDRPDHFAAGERHLEHGLHLE